MENAFTHSFGHTKRAKLNSAIASKHARRYLKKTDFNGG